MYFHKDTLLILCLLFLLDIPTTHSSITLRNRNTHSCDTQRHQRRHARQNLIAHSSQLKSRPMPLPRMSISHRSSINHPPQRLLSLPDVTPCPCSIDFYTYDHNLHLALTHHSDYEDQDPTTGPSNITYSILTVLAVALTSHLSKSWSKPLPLTQYIPPLTSLPKVATATQTLITMACMELWRQAWNITYELGTKMMSWRWWGVWRKVMPEWIRRGSGRMMRKMVQKTIERRIGGWLSWAEHV